ncbi:nicotinamide-nucleotide amidohydrolase family protein [Patescibacteria group bacterium]|nr:nicotinamide-nucleotide amidohydrolase family protein [Patescibacteria group bacterium]
MIKKHFEEINLRKEKFKKGFLEKKIKFSAKNLVKNLKRKKLSLATMESCTGGALINTITNIPGASEITKGGFVPYSVQEKIALGIPRKLIKKYSVYSPKIAEALAQKAKKKIKGSDIGIGITGIISRPDPKFPEKRVGQVDIGVVFKDRILVKRFYFPPKKERKLTKAMVVLKTLEIIGEIVKE